MFKLNAKIVVNPKRPAGFNKQHKLNTIVAEVGGMGLSYYFIHMMEKEYGPWINLTVPMFGLHVTVVKGQERWASNDHLQYLPKSIVIDIDQTSISRTPWSGDNPAFWTLKVVCPQLQEIRSFLKVKSFYEYIPHITVARESLNFSMFARNISNDEIKRLISMMLGMIPERHGNQHLVSDLRIMLHTMKYDPTFGKDVFYKMLHSHIPTATKDWELKVLSLIKDKVRY